MRAQPLIAETLKLEETRFKKTLGTGLKLLDDETRGLSAGGTLKGEVAFKLYDTFGFPLDLTQDVLRARDITVDTAGFEKSMDEQRAKARAAWAGSGETADQAIWFDVRQKVGATEFLGYDAEQAEGKVMAIVLDGKEVAGAQGRPERLADRQPDAVLRRVRAASRATPAASSARGRRGGDRSTCRRWSATCMPITPTVEKGEIKVGDDVVMTVDPIRRAQLRAHHSATHLLHEALRRHLGKHVTQKGSLVAPDRLRFDISHTKPISAEELRAVEDEVNERIRLNSPVETRLMTPEEAIAAGAMALFGEKYGDEVRVLSMGGKDGENYSVELCGGTHALRTGDIGLFRILGEGAVSAGVRRIEAVAGNAAEAHVRHQIDLLNQAASVMKVRPEDLPTRLQALIDGQRKIERELSEARKALALAGGGRRRRRRAGRRGARGRGHQDDRPRAERRAGQGPQGHGRRVQEEAGLGRGRADRRRGGQGLGGGRRHRRSRQDAERGRAGEGRRRRARRQGRRRPARHGAGRRPGCGQGVGSAAGDRGRAGRGQVMRAGCAGGALLLVLLLAACDQQAPQQQADAKSKPANAEKYARDRELCRSTVDDYMKERRNIDDSRREVFRGDYDRYGRGDLPETMANYGENRSSDRLIERCMEQRGWPAPPKPWWQKIGS